MKKKYISRPPIPHIFFLQKQNKTKIKTYYYYYCTEKRKIAKNLEKNIPPSLINNVTNYTQTFGECM